MKWLHNTAMVTTQISTDTTITQTCFYIHQLVPRDTTHYCFAYC